MATLAADHHDVMVPIPFQLRSFRKETHDTFTIDLVSTDDQQRFPFKPGQFNMLYMYGIGEVPISISGDPNEDTKIVHTIRAYGMITNKMMALKQGDNVGVRGPFGKHWPIEDLAGHDIVIAAGGIGLAPLRPVLYHILSHRGKYGKVTLLYGERTPGDLLYRRQIEQWRGRFDLEILVTVDSAREGWRGNVGVVTTLIPRAQFDPSSTFAMICGPGVMMYYTIRELEQRGLGENQIYISMERNMKCGVGFCGHCQMGPSFVCKDGPVYLLKDVKEWFMRREI